MSKQEIKARAVEEQRVASYDLPKMVLNKDRQGRRCDVWKAFRCSLEKCVARVHQRPKFLWLAPSPALANRFLGGARAPGGAGGGQK